MIGAPGLAHWSPSPGSVRSRLRVTFPPQSLAVRSARRSPARRPPPARTFRVGGCRLRPARAAPLRPSKLGLCSAAPLPRSWSVPQGLTNPASGSSVHRSGSDLRPLDRGPCRLHRARFPVPLQDRCAPLSNFDLSLGAPGLPPVLRTQRVQEGTCRLLRLLSRGLLPLQRSRMRASTVRGLASAATFRPRRFSRPRRFPPPRIRPGISPGGTRGVFRPSGFLPARRGLRRLRLRLPS